MKEEHDVYGFSKDEFNITNKYLVSNTIKKIKPHIVINCGACTNVDYCEANAKVAYEVNTLGVLNLAKASDNNNSLLIQISSDYVFDGLKKSPYSEDNTPNPINVYGRTKWISEEIVKKVCNKYYIIRTSRVFGFSNNNFVEKIISKIENNNLIKIVDDQIGNPTYSVDLAYGISYLISRNKYGIYNITNEGYCSWFQFASKIIEYFNSNVLLIPIKSSEYRSKTRRPKYTVLDNSKINCLGYKSPKWEESLKSYIEHRGTVHKI